MREKKLTKKMTAILLAASIALQTITPQIVYATETADTEMESETVPQNDETDIILSETELPFELEITADETGETGETELQKQNTVNSIEGQYENISAKVTSENGFQEETVLQIERQETNEMLEVMLQTENDSESGAFLVELSSPWMTGKEFILMGPDGELLYQQEGEKISFETEHLGNFTLLSVNAGQSTESETEGDLTIGSSDAMEYKTEETSDLSINIFQLDESESETDSPWTVMTETDIDIDLSVTEEPETDEDLSATEEAETDTALRMTEETETDTALQMTEETETETDTALQMTEETKTETDTALQMTEETETETDTDLQMAEETETDTDLQMAEEENSLPKGEEEKEQQEETYIFEDREVKIMAYVKEQAGFSKYENVSLTAEKLEPGDTAFEDAVETLKEGLGLEEDDALLFLPYDIYFLCDGNRVEPDECVTVRMEFLTQNEVLKEIQKNDMFVAHIRDDGEAEQLEAETVQDNIIEFTTPSFSVMGLAAVLLAEEPENAYAILYENGDMVFQRGNTPDESKGTVVGVYTGFETANYSGANNVPWSSQKTNIKSVSFKDEITPVSCAHWFNGATNMVSFDGTNLNTSNSTNFRNMFLSCSNIENLNNVSDWDMSNVTDTYNMFAKCEKLKQVDGSNWNLINVTNTSNMFLECKNLQSVKSGSWNLSKVTDANSMFRYCNALTSVDTSNFDMSSCKNCYRMFSFCNALTDIDTSKWNMDKVENTANMFYDCKSLKNLDTKSWTLGNNKNASSMFYNCKSLTSLDTSSWSLASCQNVSQMFNYCSALTTIGDTNGWNLSKVTNAQGMFWRCYALESLDTSNWNMGSCTDFSQMFSLCNVLSDIDVSGWKTDNATKTVNMFYDCKNIRTLNTKNWVLDKVTTAEQMFYNCNNLVNLYTDSWGLNSCTNTKRMFYGCSALSDINTRRWNLSKVTIAEEMFRECATLTTIDASNWGMNNCTNINNMFRSCTNMQTIDTSGWDLSKVTTASSAFYNNLNLVDLGNDDWKISVLETGQSMFSGCSKLENIHTLNWDMSHVTEAKEMFRGCSSLSELETGNWDLSQAVSLSNFLNGCSSLTTIDATNWGLNNVQLVDAIFANCSALETISGTENWNLSKVTAGNSMFSGCAALIELFPAGWNLSKVTNISNMFNACSSLKVLDMSSWDLTKTTGFSNLFQGCENLVKFVVGENFKFHSSMALPFNSWIRVSNQQVYTKNELYEGYDGATMADTYCQAIVFQFHGNGGMPSLKTMNGYLDMTIEELPEASKTGSYFAGWFTEANGGTQLQAGDALSQIDYYARWNNYQYTLILKSMNENEDELSIPLSYDDCYKLSDKLFTNGNMVLTGWNTRKDGSGTTYAANEEVLQMTDEDGASVVLYAQWKDVTELVTVSFDSQGGSEVTSKSIEKGSTIGDLPQSKRSGYLFDSWRIGSPDGPAVTKDTIITEDTVLYATWNQNPLVTFHGNGVVKNTNKTVRYGSKIGSLPSYTSNINRPQILIGWFTEPEAGEKITSDTIITEDIVFYAHWGWQPQFNANGGTITNAVTYPVKDSSEYLIESLPVAEKDGFRIDGWYLPDGTEVHEGDTIDLSGGAEIKALWKPENVVSIDFDPNGGTLNGKTGTTSLNVYKDKDILSIYIPQRDGYEFCGWSDKNGNLYTDASLFADDITLYAQWKKKDCKVTFVPGDGTMYQSSKVQYIPSGSTINTIPGSRKIGYILDGWYTQENGQGEKLTKDTVITSDMTYYANYVLSMTMNSDDAHMYSYGVEWSNASNSNVDNVDGNLEFHPTNGEQQTASLHVRFELNKSIGDTSLPIGSVKIKIPKYIWEDWDGNETGTNNVSALLPVYPEIRNGMYFSYYEEEDGYVLVNNQELIGGAGVDVTVSYNVDPWNVRGGATDVNDRYVDGYDYYSGAVPVSMMVDSNLDGVVETQIDDELTVEIHTQDDATAKKEYWSTSYSWDNRWGEKPDDADKYFYITWRMADLWYSSINQPFTYEWSEETVHDGTVIGWSRNGNTWSKTPISGSFLTEKPIFGNWNYLYVVTKHPMSLLENVPDDGVTVYNEAVLKEHWKSGYTTSQRVSDSVVMYGFGGEGGLGEFDKCKPEYYNGNRVKIIEGGQETIIDDNDVVDMAWDIHYNGGNRNTSVVWDDEAETYHAEKRTIRIKDGAESDLVYSSGISGKKYKWEPSLGNIDLSDEDYYFYQVDVKLTEKDIRQEDGVWTDAYPHEDISDYESVDLYVRYKNTNEFVFYKELYVTAAGTWLNCTLPADVVGFEVRHDSEFYSTLLYARCHMKLKPTQKIRSLIQSDIDRNTTSLFKNRCVCDIWNTNEDETAAYYHAENGTSGTDYAYKELFELNISDTYQYTRKYASSKDNVIFDVERGTQDNPIYIKAWNYNTSSRKKQVTSGILYDLLPSGTTVDVNTLFGIPLTVNSESSTNHADEYEKYQAYDNKLEPGMYDVTFVDNWEDSNRTMMVIKFAIPSDIYAVGVEFWYMLHNTYENILQTGTTVENDVAFINTTKGAVVPAVRSYDNSIISESEWYDSLKSENEDFISFAEVSTNYIPVDAFSWGFDKSIQTLTDYGHSEETIPNNEYTYRLSYSQSDYAQATNIVFYDVLEYGASRIVDGSVQFEESGWHGVLKNVNVRSISEKLTYGSDFVHCAPVVYYSTKDRSLFTGSDFNVTKSDVWTTERPADASSITAVAVDCSKNEDGSDFLIKNRQVMEVYITMTAPSDVNLVGETAYNEAVVFTKKNTDDFLTPEYSDADITLTEVEPEIHKSSNPASGTMENPEVVREDEALDYTISVTNRDTAFTLHNVIVEDTVPDGLMIDKANITVQFDNGAVIKVSDSPKVTLQKTGQKLVFTVSSMLPSETMKIVIPTVVTVSTGVLENTATITSINGIDKSLESETTYHEAKPVGLLIAKQDTAGGFVIGASLQLFDSEDNLIDAWVSADKIHYLNVKPGSYRLHEVSAPDGYLQADDVIITLDRAGNIFVNGEKVNKAVMVDEFDGQDLTVNKVVAGNMGDKTKEFHFQLQLSAAEGKTLPESVLCKKDGESSVLRIDENGCVEFTLRHNQSILFEKVQTGLNYEVTELDGASNGYVISSENASGCILNQAVEVSFVNTKNMSVPTNAGTRTPRIWLLVIAFLLTGQQVLKIKKRKKVF